MESQIFGMDRDHDNLEMMDSKYWLPERKSRTRRPDRQYGQTHASHTLNNILILIKIQEQTLEIMFSELISNTKISCRAKRKFHSSRRNVLLAHRHPNELKILWLPWWAFSTCSSWKRWAPVAPDRRSVSCLARPVSCVNVDLALISEGVGDTL